MSRHQPARRSAAFDREERRVVAAYLAALALAGLVLLPSLHAGFHDETTHRHEGEAVVLQAAGDAPDASLEAKYGGFAQVAQRLRGTPPAPTHLHDRAGNDLPRRGPKQEAHGSRSLLHGHAVLLAAAPIAALPPRRALILAPPRPALATVVSSPQRRLILSQGPPRA